jgi:hypothetical protein
MEQKESAGITTVSVSITSWVPPLVCEFDADNFDRVTAKVGWSRHRVPSGMQSTRPFKKEMERAVADLPTYKADAADLKSELIKAGGSALVKLLLKLVNWVWELETLPTAWSGVIVNLFKAGDTQLPKLQDHWYQSANVYKHVARKRDPKCTCTSQAAFRADPAQTTCSCSRASSRGWQGQQNCLCSFWTCAKRTVWRDGLSAKLLEKVWMESYGGSCET